ncbi:MAG TPA: DUF3187 family protein [Gammaproteobacteria bacterium]|nr:DUF3187 family protein [Gammaproteobacteria bacterium]
MRPASGRLAGAVLLMLGCGQALAAAGLATRDLNPILQSVYLPTLVPMGDSDGWRLDHSLYITNTLQHKSTGREELLIDAENYRYDFALRNRSGNWITQLGVPLIANSAGELDNLIDNWHDFFGLPQGKRDQFARDRIAIEYRRDGRVEYSQTAASSGLGDLSLALGYQRPGETAYFIGIELPTGSADDFSGNEAVDYAIWITRELPLDTQTTAFGMLGLSLPGDGGNLGGLLVDRIWVAQAGMEYRFYDDLAATVQLDMHSRSVEHSSLVAFGNSVQIQIGLGFLELFEQHRLDLFFAEDILVGSAPDISFGLRLARQF